ncbi:MAG TPA: hypothetical protein EYP53_05110 [Candidatus Latescibacteria bacterium]|nr:hypothetical protein [Candidatus Latescibacterota bacterium]
MSDKLYVSFTMDCERIARLSPPGGPEDWNISERAIKGFAETLFENNLIGTFFIVPETAERHRELFLELEKRGFELGMHYHAQAFLDGRYKRYLGEYSYEEQYEQLKAAREHWEKALERNVESFRTGNCSASDDTFRVLKKLGFRQGGTYIPDRNIPKFAAVWVGAYPYPHHTHPSNRLIPGAMEYFEVPITVDPEGRRTWRGEDTFHLRIEQVRKEVSPQDHLDLIDRMIIDQVEKGISIKTIVPVTHNCFDYSDRENLLRRHLDRLAKYFREVAGRLGLKLVPATIKQIHQVADAKGL